MSDRVSNVHDSVVRALFGISDVARAFFAAFLPDDLLDRIDLGTLESKPDHYVDARLGWRETDLLFRATADDREAYLYLLFEHQSTVDRWIAYRLLHTMDLIWAGALADGSERNTLPLIVPIVLSHTRSRWTAPAQMQELVGGPDALPGSVRDKVPAMTYFLFDLSSMTDMQIVSTATTASLRLFLLILRNIRNPDLMDVLRQWHRLLLEVVEEPTGLRVIELLLTYLAKAVEDMTQEKLMEVGEMAGPAAAIVVDSLAWKWMEEGREEGRKEGREEGREEGRRQGCEHMLLNMLNARFGRVPEDVRRRVSQATVEDLVAWSERLFAAGSLDEVFA